MKNSFAKPILSLISLAAILCLSGACSSDTENWPRFRGPDNNMILEGDLPTEWGMDQNVAWTYETEGDSWSSPVIWGNKVFLAAAVPVKVAPPPERQQGQPPANQEEEKTYLNEVYRWEITCVDLETGKELWKKVAREGSPRIKKHRAHNYSGETPVTDGKRVFMYWGMTGLYCFDLDGELLWEKDLGAYETQYGWGTGSSPVLYEDMLYVQVDNEENSFLVALDKESGEEKWKVSRDEKTNYGTPVIWKNRVRTELVVGGKRARGYNPLTGEVYWELQMDGRYNIPGPVMDKEVLYFGNSGFRDVPGTFFAIKAGSDGDLTPEEGAGISGGVAWSNLDAPIGNPSPLLYEGLLYLLSSRGGELTCMDPATGEIIYQEKIDKVAACWASPWAYEGKIFFYDEKGVTRVIKAGREFELLYQNALEGKFWASIAATDDALIIKGVNQMYCIKNQE